MTRTWSALLASGVAIAVLLALIYASRPLDTQIYENHHGLLNAITTSADTYQALLRELDAEQTRSGSAVATLGARVEDAGRAVSRTAAAAGHDSPQLAAYTATVERVVSGAATAASQLGALQQAMSVLRQDGPATVQRLRDAPDGPDADRFYALWLSVYEYGLGNAAGDPRLETQVAALTANATGRLAAVAGAMQRVLTGRAPLDAAVQTIREARVDESAVSLAAQLRTRHAERVRQRNNARVLLSLYSLLLFAVLAFVVYRLHASYRELNEAHDELQHANAELEDRVAARTTEVQQAYETLQNSQVQLVQAEKMSSLGQLVAGISHEINTPLLYLHSNTALNRETLKNIEQFLALCADRLTLKRLPDEDNATVRKRFIAGLKDLKDVMVANEVREELREAIALNEDNLEGLEELTRLAQGLKDFSRLDSAPVDKFNVNDGVQRTLLIARNLLKRHVTVITDLGDVPQIECAPSQINQVFLNLVTNASQAIEGKGEIAISTFVDGAYVVIAFRDTGSGIAPDILHKIRDPFFTTKEVGSGTGLGLSIVEEIVSKHKGRLAIESTPGRGSTFSVYLPVSGAFDDIADEDTQPQIEALTLPAGATEADTVAQDDAGPDESGPDESGQDDSGSEAGAETADNSAPAVAEAQAGDELAQESER